MGIGEAAVTAPGWPCRYSAAEPRGRCQAGPEEAGYQQYRRYRLRHRQIALPIPGERALRKDTAGEFEVGADLTAGQPESPRTRRPKAVLPSDEVDADGGQHCSGLRPS